MLGANKTLGFSSRGSSDVSGCGDGVDGCVKCVGVLYSFCVCVPTWHGL